jgi:hypothetical protein
VESARLEIHSRFFEVESASLCVSARFVGLRQFLYHHPVLSGLIGIAITAVTMLAVLGVYGGRVVKSGVRRNRIIGRRNTSNCS